MNIKEAKEICEKATPGPWSVSVNGNTVKSHAIKGVCSGMKPSGEDSCFIAFARTALPEALRIIEAQHEMLKKQERVAKNEYKSRGGPTLIPRLGKHTQESALAME